MLNVDIDTGGTMTDGLISGDGQMFSVKVETTPHDVTIAFVQVLEAARERVGAATLRDFLDRVGLIRWSSTITSNVLAQKTGPKIGLLVSAGNEDTLYGSAEDAAAVVGTLVARADITGIADDADDDAVRIAVKSLFDKGIRRINISLAGAFPDTSRERKIVSMIDQQYPDHFLGSIPALPASEILLRPDDKTRTFVSLINAYVHPALATTLYRAEETVRVEHGWRGNVLVGHINGGVARIGKTTAFDTIESGPLFGTHASAHHATQAADARVLGIDVGGTTAKCSAVEDGRVADRDESTLFGIPLTMNLPLLRSIALGGGSVARAADGKVRLGPDSMGAAPGPACYGLGGRNATVTDALLLLGYLSPSAFLDGRRTLSIEAAREAIARTVGEPLGVESDEAARQIADAAFDTVAKLARGTATEMGWDTTPGSPRAAAPAKPVLTVYAFGGNGPLLATAVAERLGASTVRLFGLGHVLSAYGSAISDVVHVYESAVAGEDSDSVAQRLRAEAERDLHGEGFDADAASYDVDIRGELVRLTATAALPTIDVPAAESGGGRATGERGGIPTYDWMGLAGATLDGPALVDGGSFTWMVSEGWQLEVDPQGDAKATRTEVAR